MRSKFRYIFISHKKEGNKHLLSTFYVPDTVKHFLEISFGPHNYTGNKFCDYPHFTVEATETKVK